MSTRRLILTPRACADSATVPVPPSTNNLFRTVGARRFRTKKYEEWADYAVPRLATIRPPAEFPVCVVVRITGKLNVQRDCDNALKPLADGLVEAGVLPDDNVKHVTEWDVLYVPGPGDAQVTVSLRPARRAA